MIRPSIEDYIYKELLLDEQEVALGFTNFLKSNNDIFIPYNRICKIGKDIILVDIIIQQSCNCNSITTCNNCNTHNKNNQINIQSILNNLDKDNQK